MELSHSKLTSKQYVLFGWSLFSFFLSCNKPENFAQIDLLAGKTWHLTSIKSNGVEISDSCDLDNTWLLEKSGDFSFSSGALACTDEVLDKTAVCWKMDSKKGIIRLNFKFSGNNARGSLIEYWEIVTLNDSALVVKDASAESSSLIPEVRTFK